MTIRYTIPRYVEGEKKRKTHVFIKILERLTTLVYATNYTFEKCIIANGTGVTSDKPQRTSEEA